MNIQLSDGNKLVTKIKYKDNTEMMKKLKFTPKQKLQVIKLTKTKIKKHFKEGGGIYDEKFKTFLSKNKIAYNFNTKRFVKYGGRVLNKFGQIHRGKGFIKNNILLKKDYYSEINEILENVIDTENFEYDLNFKNYLPISPSEIIKMMIDKFKGLQITINFGNKGYTLTKESTTRLLNNYLTGDVENLTDSDAEFISHMNQGTILSLNNLGVGKSESDGSFFKYYYNTNINLSRYGIFKNKEESNYKNNCLINAILCSKSKICSDKLISGLFKKLIDSKFIKTRNVPIKLLDSICDKIKHSITLTQYFDKKDTYKTKTYGKKYKKNIKIGLIDKHYFLIEKTNYTMFSIKNYEEIKNENNFNYIVNKKDSGYLRDKSKTINSYTLIKYLFKNKNQYLKEINIDDQMIISPYFEEVKNKNFFSLNYNDDEIREVRKYKPVNELYDLNNHDLFMSDFECGFDKSSKHIPYLCCIRKYQKYDANEDSIKPNGRAFYDSDKISSAQRLLNYVIKNNPKKTKVLFFHNLKYDFQFLTGVTGLVITSVIAPNNKEISVECIYKKTKIILRDTLCMITNSLKNFGKMFGLKTIKEIMPYEIYTEQNIKNRFIEVSKIKECIDFQKFVVNPKCKRKKKKIVDRIFDLEKWNQYLENATKWNCLKKDNTIDIIQYSKIYCLIDCKVLNDGYDIFRGWILELTGIDIINVLTLSSVADKYVIKENAYEGVYELSSIPRMFIQKCLVGGKTMTNQNKAHIDFRNIKNRDLDLNSSYPDSYCRIGGFLKGKPKIIKESIDVSQLLKKDGLFVKIKILSIDKLDFPLLSYKNEDGIRTWSNNVDDLNKHGVYLGKFSLLDAIEFGNMKFEILQGYYFDDGRNEKLPILTRKLYDARKKLKKESNKAEAIYKLILNSIFGKTALKSFGSELIIKNQYKYVGNASNLEEVKKYYIKKNKSFNEKLYLEDLGFLQIHNDKCYINEAHKFIRRNYNNINNFIVRGNYYFIEKIYNVGTHFNRVHCAVDVLDMSKRSLNEVLVLCNTNSEKYIKVGIIDTDSVQVAKKDVPLIKKLFQKKYNKEFFGKKLGQWDDDFKMSKSNNLSDILAMKDLDKSEIDSVGAIYLKKKMYIHHLKSADGNEGYHIRMKGIPTKSIYYYCYKNNCSPMNVYESLYEGKEIKFDLNCGGHMKKFKFDSINNEVHFNDDFTRVIKI